MVELARLINLTIGLSRPLAYYVDLNNIIKVLLEGGPKMPSLGGNWNVIKE